MNLRVVADRVREIAACAEPEPQGAAQASQPEARDGPTPIAALKPSPAAIEHPVLAPIETCMPREHWTDVEEQWLLDHYAEYRKTGRMGELGPHFNRTLSSVQIKAGRLGLTSRQGAARDRRRPDLDRLASRHPWTDAEVGVLTERYPAAAARFGGLTELAGILKRDRKAVREKARWLGLTSMQADMRRRARLSALPSVDPIRHAWEGLNPGMEFPLELCTDGGGSRNRAAVTGHLERYKRFGFGLRMEGG